VGWGAGVRGGAGDPGALRVRERARVFTEAAERPAPARRQIERRGPPHPAGADDQNTRALERLLPRPADLVQYDMAGIAVELPRPEHGGSPAPPPPPLRKRRRCPSPPPAMTKHPRVSFPPPSFHPRPPAAGASR